MSRRRTRFLEAACVDLVERLEGDGSVMVRAEQEDLDPVGEMILYIDRAAVRDLRRTIRVYAQRKRTRGFDPVVFIAHRLALYYSAWYAWVVEAKARDADRAARDRRNYGAASRDFPKDLSIAVRAGRSRVVPIMKKRGNRIVPR